MTDRANLPSIPGTVALFTLTGPLVAAALAPLMLVLGGPLGLLLYPVYLIFWLPSFYIILAPPFFFAGLLYGAAMRRGRPGLGVALAASLAGLAVSLGLRVLVTGTVTTPIRLDVTSDRTTAVWLILLVCVAATACRSLIRGRDHVSRFLHLAAWPRGLRRAMRMLSMIVTVAVVGSAVALSRPPPPRTAWDRCIEPEDRHRQIQDCSTVFDSPAEPTDRRLKAIESRIGSYVNLASAGSDDPETIALYDHIVGDAETAQRLFGADEAVTLAYGRLHRGQLLASRGEIGRAIADFDETIRLGGDGVLARQARKEKQVLSDRR